MPISPARTTAYRILQGVETSRRFAVDLLQTEEVSALRESDRRLANELVMGVLRWRGELDFQIGELSGKPVQRLDPEVETILRLGVYQIQFLERVPKSAAVNDAVELTKKVGKRSAAGFVNAVLRKCPLDRKAAKQEQFENLDRVMRERVRRATPAWLLERWAAIKTPAIPANPADTSIITAEAGIQFAGDRSNDPQEGMAEDAIALRIAWASNQVPPTVLRVVDAAQDIPRLREELAAEGITTKPGRFSDRALVVQTGNVQSSRVLREGRVVIQDEASQLVAELLAPRAGQRVLDLCAAPGIKAGQLAQILGSGTLVTCDRSATRLQTLASLLPKWLPKDVRQVSVRLDATQTLPFGCLFDRILLDAPCSGTGTLARNPEIKWRLRPEDLKRLADAQVEMLKRALEFLTATGRLVYATCSLEPEENEQVVERVLNECPGFQAVSQEELRSTNPAFSPLIDLQGFLRTRPDLHAMDGFFAATITRKNEP